MDANSLENNKRKLYVAPAGAGKTEFVLERARQKARAWGTVRVVVGSSQQARAGYRRLAQKGAFGVRMHTLSGLARELLDRAGVACTLLTDPVQIRFLRALVDQARLDYYAPLVRMPGFIRALRDVFAELTRAEVAPGDFIRAVAKMGDEPRLAELAKLYRAYHAALAARNWTDPDGLITCAVKALEQHSELARDWDLLAVDGFNRFHASELTLLQTLSERVNEFIITMTGDVTIAWEQSVAKPWREAWEQAAHKLSLTPQPLPDPNPNPNPLFSLTSHLLHPTFTTPETFASLDAIAAPDQIGEVRTALRWLKQRLVERKLDLSDVAIMARDLTPYQDAIAQLATEFGMPVTIVGGLPLRENPAVDALMSLLNLFTPQPSSWNPQADLRFPYRGVVAAWRSPYFDWRWRELDGDADETLGIHPADADALDALARWGQVVSGAGQWWDAFRRRAKMANDPEQGEDAWRHADEPGLEALRGEAARALWKKWLCFRRALTPPQGAQPVQVFVRWMEDLIGSESGATSSSTDEYASSGTKPFTLNMLERIQASGNERLVQRDLAALNAFKEVLRGMVWAAESLGLPRITFQEFLTDLGGALEAARYQPARQPGRQTIMAGPITAFAGMRFRTIAILGLAEGIFPATLQEDAFLRSADRESLRRVGWSLDPSPDNREAAFFYLAVSRADEYVLITRPRLAEGGAVWQASPFWHWLLQATGVTPIELTHENSFSQMPIASHPELMLAIARGGISPEMQAKYEASRLARWMHGVQVATLRYAQRFSPFDGDLTSLSSRLRHRFGPEHIWSVRRLETYRSCGYWFFAQHVLKLTPRDEPKLGLDRLQLGNFFHHALELVFRKGADKADDAEALIAIWEAMADELLDQAPEKFGFRPTAWWPQTREQMKTTIRRTLERMAEENQGWRPRAFEAPFGYRGNPALKLNHPQRRDVLRLSGFIDRVDHDGGEGMRIIDYKTGSVRDFTEQAVREGKHLQLPLYALAAQHALGYGQAVDGFYWSVTKAEASKLRLQTMGVHEAAFLATSHAWEAVEGVRIGRFQPQPPANGCDLCPAASFCWRYRPGRRN